MVERQVSGNLIGVDIGNSRIKFGQFQLDSSGDRSTGGRTLPEPIATFDLPIVNETGEFDSHPLGQWCEKFLSQETAWLVASVHRAVAARLTTILTEWATKSHVGWPIRQLTYLDVPLTIHVDAPGRVGIDRLLAALAADRLRQREHAAIIVDLGTAITVDLLEADGAFAGGAILPGVAMSARSLAEQTDALPRVGLEFLDQPPEPLGKSTVSAIESGIYWGAIGAIREVIAQLSAMCQESPDIFITGGASRHIAELLTKESSVRHMPNLVLSGIALVEQ